MQKLGKGDEEEEKREKRDLKEKRLHAKRTLCNV
jgi:hypothetical protein